MLKNFVFTFSLILLSVFIGKQVVDSAFEKSEKTIHVAVYDRSATLEIAEVKQEKDLDYTPSFNVKKTEPVIVKKVKFLTIVKPKTKLKNILPTNQASNTVSLLKEEKIDLSYKEIKEQEKITLKNVNKIAWHDFKIKNYEYAKFEETIIAKKSSDRISTLASATEKSSQKNNINNEVISQKSKPADELVFFEYSEDGSVITKEAAVESTQTTSLKKAPVINGISKKVSMLKLGTSSKSTIDNFQNISLEDMKRKLGKAKKVVTTQSQPNLPNPYDRGENGFIDNSDKKKGNDDGSSIEEQDYSCLDEKKQKRKSYKSEYDISLSSYEKSLKKFQKIHNFEIRFQDDLDDIAQDFGEGVIKLKYNLSTQMNVRRGVILSSGVYPLSLDFVFEGIKTKFTIPAIKTDTFNEYTEKLDITGLGSQLLVELDDNTEDVDIDVKTKYESKVYLDSKYKMVDRADSNYAYILFIGVDPGNTVVYFKTIKNEITNKIIHLAEKEIYYEPNFYAEMIDDRVELFQEKLLSKCKGMLDVNEESLKPWSFDGNVKKQSINNFTLDRMIYPLGTRKYMELKHLDESIFIGRWSENEVVVPDEDYVRHALSNFDINGNECLIQLNLTNKVKEIHYNSQSSIGAVRTRAKFLDDDGTFYPDVSDNTKRIFIMGEEQGIVNLKLSYIDGTSQFIQTFCSNSTYLVEQL